MANAEVQNVIAWLKGLGFRVTPGGKHYRVEHARLPGSSTMPTTPSDVRWMDNCRSELRQSFPGIDPGVWDAFPGRSGVTRSTVRDQYPGTRIVNLLEDLIGARGTHDFAGNLEVDRSGRAPVLTIRNPFYSPGSDDDLRSEELLQVPLSSGRQPLSWPAVEALKDLGVDLECESVPELQRAFLAFSREQRTVSIAEYERRQAERRIAGDAFVGRPTGRTVPEVRGR